MGIGRIFTKAAAYLSHTKAANVLRSGNVQSAARQVEIPAQSSIWSKIETNTPGRILRMQEAKDAFSRTSQVTHESVPTLQKIEEITGVTRGQVKDATGYKNKKRAADALAAFKHEPVKLIYSGGSCAKSVPTQKAIDDMLGIVEDTPKTRLELLRKRAEIRDAFNGIYRTNTDRTLEKMKLEKLKDIPVSNKFEKKVKANELSSEEAWKFKSIRDRLNLDEYYMKILTDPQFREMAKRYNA